MHIFSVVLVLTDSNNTETALKLAGFSLNNYKSPRQTRTNTKNYLILKQKHTHSL